MTRTSVFLALVTLLFSVLWLIFLIASKASAGPLDSFDSVLAHVAKGGILFYLTYYNAALVTLSATAFFAAIYRHVRQAAPTRAHVGLVFVPVYCAINLIVYLSQVTVVPTLTTVLNQPEMAGAARLLLTQLIQEWPASGMAFFNNLAYALLGIPSIIFGLILTKEKGALRTGGLLLTLNGLACFLGVFGILARISALSIGSVVGGVLFIAALPFLAAGLRS